MKKYIVLSVNDNPDYYYFLPLTKWAWEYFGWGVIVLYSRNDITDFRTSLMSKLEELSIQTIDGLFRPTIIRCNDIGYKTSMVAQISRLYAACLTSDDDILMLGDIDLLPLGDHWQPNGNPIVWNFDLTGYTEYPMCFVSMKGKQWKEVMRIEGNDIKQNIKRDLDSMPNAKSDDFHKFWGVDQQLITQRLKPFKPTIINRGQYPNGYARGRVDRGAWTLDHKEFIDAHLHHQIHHKQNDWKFQQTLELLRKVWPEENFDWYIEYHNEFKRLTGHV